MPINPPPCDTNASWPAAPLRRAPEYNTMSAPKSVEFILVDVVSCADPENSFQVTAYSSSPGVIQFALPETMEPGDWELTAHLYPRDACPPFDLGPTVMEVE